MTSNLATKAKLSVLWNTGFNLFRDGLQFCVMLVLVRILSPEAYGQFGLVNSIIGFLSVFGLQNFISHTLQVRKDEDVHYQDHFTAGAFIQTGMFLLTNVVALVLRLFENYASVAPLVHILSFTFLFEWPCLLSQKMLERELNWKRFRLLHGIGLIFTSCLSIALGLLGAGVYSLILPGMFVTFPFIYDLYVNRSWKPLWKWNKQHYMASFRFGIARIASGIMTTARPLIENGVIVFILGYSGVGLMGRAVGLSTMFCTRLATQLMVSIYPVLTKVEPGTEKYRKMSALILQLVAWVAIPIAAVFSILAKPVVFTMYGDKWAEVIPLLPLAMTLAVLASVIHTTYMLLLAHSEQNLCAKIDFIAFIGHLVIIFKFIPYGLDVYLKSLVIFSLILMTLFFMALYKLKILNILGIFYAISPPTFGIILAASILKIITNVANIQIYTWISAAFYGLGFSVLYLAFLRFFYGRQLNNLCDYVPGKSGIKKLLLFNEA